MAFDIESFKAQGLPRGGARPSLFRVSLHAVPGIPIKSTTSGATALQAVSFLCQAASIPASEVDPIEVPYFGRRVSLAGERVFRPWNINIMNDEDFAVRDMFESWSNMINTLETNISLNGTNLTSYKVNSVSVQQYTKGGPSSVGAGSADDTDEGAVIANYAFFGMWPSRVGDIRLDWSQGQAIETYDVTLAYDYWLPVKLGQAQASYTGQESGGGLQTFAPATRTA